MRSSVKWVVALAILVGGLAVWTSFFGGDDKLAAKRVQPEETDEAQGAALVGVATDTEQHAREHASQDVPVQATVAEQSTDAALEEGRREFTVFPGGSDVTITKTRSDGFFSMQLPLLRPTEERDRTVFVFGANRAQEPQLLSVEVQTFSDTDPLTILIDPADWQKYDVVVVTVPEWGDEKPRIVVSLAMTDVGEVISYPADAEPPCYVVDYTSVNVDGFLSKRLVPLEPAAPISVRPEHVGLVALLPEPPDLERDE